jgi:hypothetical protein
MASNMKVLEDGLAFGLMGSMEWVEQGTRLETVLVGGTEMRHTLELWGSTLATYLARNQVITSTSKFSFAMFPAP